MLETAPKKNISELPRKNATTVVMQPILAVLLKRAKLGVAVPPDTKLPITRPAPVMMVSEPSFTRANCSARVLSPRRTASIIATVPRIPTRGTAIQLTMVRLLIPKNALAVMRIPATATSTYPTNGMWSAETSRWRSSWATGMANIARPTPNQPI